MNGIDPPTPMSTGSVPSQASAKAAPAASYAGPVASIRVASPVSLPEFTDPWPTNSFTGEPMTPGYGSGDYTFHTATSMGDGQEYLCYVDVVLSNSEVYSAPFEY